MVFYQWVIVCAFVLYVINFLVRRLKISKYENKHVFITGCDSVFGLLLARRLDDMGFMVHAGCLTEKGQKSVQKLCSERTQSVPIDVASDASIEKAVEIVKRSLQNGEGLWAVVNNAGVIGGIGPTTWHTRQDYENTLAVNLYGVIFVTKAFLPLLIPSKGRVVNMASTCGRIAIVGPSYTVSKYGVEAFSDMLRRELLVLGMKVSIIEPGFFNTPLLDEESYRKAAQDKIDSLPPEVRRETAERAIDRVLNGMQFIKSKFASDDTYKVVDAYVDAITAKFPKARYLVGNDVNYIYRVLWNLPEWLADILVLLWMSR